MSWESSIGRESFLLVSMGAHMPLRENTNHHLTSLRFLPTILEGNRATVAPNIIMIEKEVIPISMAMLPCRGFGHTAVDDVVVDYLRTGETTVTDLPGLN